MRTHTLAAALVLLSLSRAAAQPPAPAAPPTADPREARLDELLQAWEKRMAQVQTLAARCERKDTNKTFQSSDECRGVARYMKPNLAKLDLVKNGNTKDFEKYVCTGKFLYEYRPKEKMVRIHEIPQRNNGQVADETFLSFMFGMKAADAKANYYMRLTKEDANYIYIDVLPKRPQDKQEFSKAQLVFYAGGPSAMLPRRLWFESPNGDETAWGFPEIQTNVQLAPQDFVAPKPPQDWQEIRADKQQVAPAAAPAQRGDGRPMVVPGAK